MRFSRGPDRLRPVIADHTSNLHASQFTEHVRPGAPRNNNARIDRGQVGKQLSRPDSHPRLVRMLNNGCQRPVEIECAQSPLGSQPRQDRAGSPGKEILHPQTVEPALVRSAKRPVTRS